MTLRALSRGTGPPAHTPRRCASFNWDRQLPRVHRRLTRSTGHASASPLLDFGLCCATTDRGAFVCSVGWADNGNNSLLPMPDHSVAFTEAHRRFGQIQFWTHLEEVKPGMAPLQLVSRKYGTDMDKAVELVCPAGTICVFTNYTCESDMHLARAGIAAAAAAAVPGRFGSTSAVSQSGPAARWRG